MDKILVNDVVTFEFTNIGTRTLYLFYGIIYSHYEIVDDNETEVHTENYSTWDTEIPQYNFSYNLIKETADLYNLELEDAKNWLTIKNNYYLLKPGEKKYLKLSLDEYKYDSYRYILKNRKDYYAKGVTSFSSSIIPEKVKDSLKQRDINIYNNFKIDFKIKVNKHKFFKKECQKSKCYYID
ncbi:hypothetical protein [Chryseobacterium chendengshani]|uniref:hypothetical protein n=1 Tax=Chryseobacterium sp. LJ756 TaxID=2864113 RepID=UPI001C63DB27|nr:hypothetical protein [Chryseobacterium sp. LJ756]MBW7676693.1 hypothetical protein [Chryseobacterium sp. LJ756]